MTSWKKSVSALAMVATMAAGAGVATLAANPALAQPAATEGGGMQGGMMQGGMMHHGEMMHHGWHRHGKRLIGPMLMLNGRIAFMKTVLQITPAEEPAFDKFADAMRANVTERMSTWKEMRETHIKGPMTAVDLLAAKTQMSQMRAQADARLLAAFKPLYQALSPDQQKVANRLAWMVAMRHGMHRPDNKHHER